MTFHLYERELHLDFPETLYQKSNKQKNETLKTWLDMKWNDQ